jgi:NADH-quinone oxidoreductase subunit L
MLIPLVILATLSVIAGFFPMADFVNVGEPLAHHGINFGIAIPAALVALFGLGVAAFFYTGEGEKRATAVTERLGRVYQTIKNKFYIDEVYLFVTHRIIFHFISRPIAWFDRNVVDGGVNLSGWITRTSGKVLSYLQTGQVQTYAVWYVLSAVVVAGLLWRTLP